MPAEEFVKMASEPMVLGNRRLRTQHFIGATRWEKISDTEVLGYHQLRVPHQLYMEDEQKNVLVKGHAHSTNVHKYCKVDGV